MEVSSILFMDDYELFPQPEEKFIYIEKENFVRVFVNGRLKELINIQQIRSMCLV